MNIFLLLIILISQNAFSQVSKGNLIEAIKFNSSTFHIGSIQQTILSELQFQQIAGNCWVKMRGQSIEGSDLSILTGRNFLPDSSGRFLRDEGGDAAPVGETQQDQMQRITGQFRLSRSDSDNVSGAFTRVTHGSDRPSAGGNQSSRLVFDSANSPNARTSETTDGETRPVNLTVNYFIKISDNCN